MGGMKLGFKDNKLFKNKWVNIVIGVFIYSILFVTLTQVTGWLTILGAVGLFIYLFFKSNNFKQKNKFIKGIITVALVFAAIFGAAATAVTPESIEQNRLATEKAKVEKQAKLEVDKKAKDEQVKKKAEEKAKQEELAKQEEAKKAEEIKKTEEKKADVIAAAEQSQNTTISGQLKVHFIDVGQADSILVQQGSSNMLIDAGNNADAQTIKNYLDSQGVKELNVVVGTHAHEDHIGSMDYIINSFKVGKVYFPKQTATTKTFQEFVTAVKNKGLQLTAPVVGNTFKVGDVAATILAPNGSGYDDANDYSIVIKLAYGSTSFLLTGDAEAISESQMVSKGLNLSATVLKVGHHGSKSSTSQAFLNKVNPKFAVISVGKGNSYGHPTQETLTRLKNKGITVYRTDENGTIVATSDGNTVSFSTKPGSYNGIASSSANSSTSKNNSTSSNNITKKPSSNNSSSSKTTTTPKQSSSGTKVYWLTTGTSKSYHKNPNCQYIRNKTVNSGSVQDAINDNHADPCNKCVK